MSRSDDNSVLIFERKELHFVFDAMQENVAYEGRYNFELEKDHFFISFHLFV